MPQAKTNWKEYESYVLELSDKIVKEYKIDKNRISIAGFSLGGYSVMRLVPKNQNYFSAAVPMGCGATYSSAFLKLPVWTFAGNDGTSSSLNSFVNTINKKGGNARHTYVSSSGHNIMNDNYSVFRDEKYDLINWMISQKK